MSRRNIFVYVSFGVHMVIVTCLVPNKSLLSQSQCNLVNLPSEVERLEISASALFTANYLFSVN